MPIYRSLEVSITDKDDVPLKKYSVRHNDRAKICTCFIESEKDKPFRISITPTKLLWPEFRENGERAYHLLATLRLDGRRSWEKRSLIYLDYHHPQYRRPRGQVKMVFRTVKDDNGELRDCGWFFVSGNPSIHSM